MTPNFTLSEFTRSEVATRRAINNCLPDELLPVANATLEMMERIRAHLSKLAGKDVPVRITSGYRSPALNVLVGSASTSDHPRACAVDFEADSFGVPTEICKALAPVVSVLGIGQLINEYPDRNGWCHVSTRLPAQAINRVLTITRAGTQAGIHGG
jgi:uncharacterized protein YcbK (DUF882 family)